MNTAPRFVPIDEDTDDLLALVADAESPVGRDAVAAFLAACENDARRHAGLVSINRVSAALADEGIEHHRYSSFWGRFTGPGRPMRRATDDDTRDPWEIREGSTSGNNGKPMPLRVWTGTAQNRQAVAS